MSKLTLILISLTLSVHAYADNIATGAPNFPPPAATSAANLKPNATLIKCFANQQGMFRPANCEQLVS